MPSYASHPIMAKDVYKKLKNKDNVSLDYILTFSQGADFSKFSKARWISHKEKYREDFFKNMCDYIKQNNLENDPETLGTLYGHICHFALDDIAHPLVRKLSKECKPSKNNHSLIESFYDKYLIKKHINLSVKEYLKQKLFKAKMNKKISKMIDYAYEKTFNVKHVSRNYKFNIWLYRKIKYVYDMFGVDLIHKIIGVKKFLKANKDIDILNNNRKTSYKLDNKKENLSLDELYDLSIKKALKDINKINKYLK